MIYCKDCKHYAGGSQCSSNVSRTDKWDYGPIKAWGRATVKNYDNDCGDFKEMAMSKVYCGECKYFSDIGECCSDPSYKDGYKKVETIYARPPTKNRYNDCEEFEQVGRVAKLFRTEAGTLFACVWGVVAMIIVVVALII